MTNVADEVLGKIARQQADLFRRVHQGTLDPTLVSRSLQDIIDGKFAKMIWKQPTWWRTLEQQLERARELWPDAVLPEPPAEFTPRTKSEVLLLHVPDSFGSLCNKVGAPAGHTTCRWSVVKVDKRKLRLAPNKREYTEPVWLAFDPEHGKGERPDSFWSRTDIAASEVFSALIQFPEWPLAWFKGASAPNLTGYQLGCDSNWSHVPCLHPWFDDRLLELRDSCADGRYDHWSSPSVREC